MTITVFSGSGFIENSQPGQQSTCGPAQSAFCAHTKASEALPSKQLLECDATWAFQGPGTPASAKCVTEPGDQ